MWETFAKALPTSDTPDATNTYLVEADSRIAAPTFSGLTNSGGRSSSRTQAHGLGECAWTEDRPCNGAALFERSAPAGLSRHAIQLRDFHKHRCDPSLQELGFEIAGTLPGAFWHPEKAYVDVYVMYRSLLS